MPQVVEFYIKQNDTSPALNSTLQDQDGNVVDITGATVRFHMVMEGEVDTKVDAAASVVSAANGQVRYNWQAGDVDTVGIFNAEFEVTYSDSSIETFPNDSHIKVIINDDLA